MIHLLLVIIYVAFISLGLPDGLLGAAWPSMYEQMGVGVSMMGPVSFIIAAGTGLSSLLSDRVNRRFGTGRVTAVSVAMTATALIGFASCRAYWQLCLWAVPYGLGAGSVDSGLNNYVAIHYESRHMSWLHGMWGLGAAAGPYIMGWVLTGGQPWGNGYLYIGIAQCVLTVLLFVTLPIWKTGTKKEMPTESVPLPIRETLRVPGVKAVCLVFFCYCALEQTVAHWISSYMVIHVGLSAEAAAGFAGLFFGGLTLGRVLSGFMTMRFTDRQMVNIGNTVIGVSLVLMALPLGAAGAVVSLGLLGLGCAPIYPCVIHATPENFGVERSQMVIGLQMVSACAGCCLMPPVFGLIMDFVGAWTMPFAALGILIVMALSHERMCKVTVLPK